MICAFYFIPTRRHVHHPDIDLGALDSPRGRALEGTCHRDRVEVAPRSVSLLNDAGLLGVEMGHAPMQCRAAVLGPCLIFRVVDRMSEPRPRNTKDYTTTPSGSATKWAEGGPPETSLGSMTLLKKQKYIVESDIPRPQGRRRPGLNLGSPANPSVLLGGN